RTFAGEDDDADLAVVARHVERGFQLRHRPRPKRIPHFGTCDRDLRDAVFSALVFDVFQVVQFAPDFSHRPRNLRQSMNARNRSANASGTSHGTRCAAPGATHNSAFETSSAARFASATYFASRSPATNRIGIRNSCSRDATGGRAAGGHSRSAFASDARSKSRSSRAIGG